MGRLQYCGVQVPGAARSPAAVGAPDGRQAGALQRKVLSDMRAALAHEWQRQQRKQPGAPAASAVPAGGCRVPRQPASHQQVRSARHRCIAV